jgi:hypothetical protein
MVFLPFPEGTFLFRLVPFQVFSQVYSGSGDPYQEFFQIGLCPLAKDLLRQLQVW